MKFYNKAFGKYITWYRAVLNFESVDEIFHCDHSNESNCAVLSCDVDEVLSERF